MNATLLALLTAAGQAGDLLPASADNIKHLLEGATSSLEERVVQELVDRKEWKELNDRFFRTLAFGTGGLRGKTIGNVITSVEAGTPRSDKRPEVACIGTNCVNNYNIVRATRGLVTYVLKWHQEQKKPGLPKIAISYDTRFFSKEFAELAAKVISEHGCDALVFEAPRSTPELSFAVRYCNATAGINITASHNPPAYNGYKVYFEDGGQVVEPHASAIIKLVDSMDGEKYEPLSQEKQGKIIMLGEALDETYKERLKTLVLDASLFQEKEPLSVVYTPLHGVGGAIIVPLLEELGVNCLPVASQMVPDGLFSTVKSPNPENAEALSLGIALAEEKKADLVLATDPDDDRMGVAVRNEAGTMELLTGNQIGALLLWYRLQQLFTQGILDDKNKERAVVVKSLVTTQLQKAIAEKQGIRCVETLTGFKYIGAKQEKYERELPAEIQASYRQLSEKETRDARLRFSSYFVFGGEESYGYNMGDFVRDKDGNAAVLCFCEVAAYAQRLGVTVTELLDRIYAEYGFYLERGESFAFEGAEGAQAMKKLMDSYVSNPLAAINEIPVLAIHNFATENLCDTEQETYPSEAMLMIKLQEDQQVVVRPSGTEPKIKYYLFAVRKSASEGFSSEELTAAKTEVAHEMDAIWQWLKADLYERTKQS